MMTCQGKEIGHGQSTTSAKRLSRLALHVGKPLPIILPEAVHARARSFIRGLIAHLLIVPPFIGPPGALFAATALAGSPFGIPGMATTVGLGGSMMFFFPKKLIPVLSALLLGVGVASRRTYAAVAAGIASLLAVMTYRSRKSRLISRSSWLLDYVDRWAKDYYSQDTLKFIGDVRPTKSFFGFHPHGCLCAGFTINGMFNKAFHRAAGRTTWLMDTNLRYKNPMWQLASEVYESDDHCIDACDGATFKHHMSTGRNVSFIVGGFMDAVVFEYGKDVCVLQSKKGFIKYCLQHGYRAHPCYTFGECETYYTFKGFKSLRHKIAQKNIPALAFFGWPLVPFLPRRESKLLTYVGHGIDMPHIANPSDVDIDHWHQVYLEALVRLFNDNKADAGYPDAELEVL